MCSYTDWCDDVLRTADKLALHATGMDLQRLAEEDEDTTDLLLEANKLVHGDQKMPRRV